MFGVVFFWVVFVEQIALPNVPRIFENFSMWVSLHQKKKKKRHIARLFFDMVKKLLFTLAELTQFSSLSSKINQTELLC